MLRLEHLIANAMGISHVANTAVGDENIRGIRFVCLEYIAIVSAVVMYLVFRKLAECHVQIHIVSMVVSSTQACLVAHHLIPPRHVGSFVPSQSQLARI